MKSFAKSKVKNGVDLCSNSVSIVEVEFRDKGVIVLLCGLML